MLSEKKISVPKHKIICGNTLDVLRKLPEESIDMVMTSPPYWGLRDYGEDTITIWGGNDDCEHEWREKVDIISSGGKGHKQDTNKGSWFKASSSFCQKCGAWRGQLGLEPTPELYIKHLCMIFAEIKRVLKKTGTCWVNIGDSYSNRGKYDPSRWKSKEIAYKPACNCKSLPPKCMVMIPERFAFMMIDLGYILRNKIIWHKPNPMPSSVKDRFNTTYEMLYFFSKNNRPVYWYNNKTGAMVTKKPSSQIEGVDWNWKESGNDKPKLKKISHWHSVDYWFDLDAVREEHKPESLIRVKGKWNGHREPMSSFQGMDIKRMCNPSGKNPGDFWSINTQSFPEAHFAVFPKALTEKPILAGCPAEVCKHCGMARVVITESKIKNDEFKPRQNEKYSGGSEFMSEKTRLRCEIEIINKGWTNCQCEDKDKYEPGIILDPFGGSGTISVEAEKLNRSSIIIDIKKEYCEMAFKRLSKLALQAKLDGKRSIIECINF